MQSPEQIYTSGRLHWDSERERACEQQSCNRAATEPTAASTSGRLHYELVRILFLQDYGETIRFFAASGVEDEFHNQDQLSFHALPKATALRINLNPKP